MTANRPRKPAAQATAVANASRRWLSTNVQTVAAATEELHASISEIPARWRRRPETANLAVAETDRTNKTVEGVGGSGTEDRRGRLRSDPEYRARRPICWRSTPPSRRRAPGSRQGFAVVATEVEGAGHRRPPRRPRIFQRQIAPRSSRRPATRSTSHRRRSGRRSPR